MTAAPVASKVGGVKPSGKISITLVLLLAGLVYGGWWVFTWGQIYLDHLEVKDAVAAAANQLKQVDDKDVVFQLVQRLNAPNLGTHKELDDRNREVVKGGLGIKPEDIVIERNRETKKGTVTVSYSREVELKPMQKIGKKYFVVTRTGVIW